MTDTLRYYLIGVFLGWDVFVNAVTGGAHYQTISCRIGESINSGGWASRVPWPASWLDHFRQAIHESIV